MGYDNSFTFTFMISSIKSCSSPCCNYLLSSHTCNRRTSGPRCGGGGCVQDNTHNPRCNRGAGCSQKNSFQPSCDGGRCDQTGSRAPSCLGGGCVQDNATNPRCRGGKCSQKNSVQPRCRLRQCDQTGSVDPSCDGGGCTSLSVEESRYLRA